MKKVLLLLLFAFTLMPLRLFAQTQISHETRLLGDSYAIDVPKTNIDSNKVYVTKWFSVQEFDDALATHPVIYMKYQHSDSAKPRITTTVEGAFFANDSVWVVDTVGIVADSLETKQYGTLNFNNTRYPMYRLKFSGTTANRKDAWIKATLWFPYRRVY
jgi:hypothetical protein